MSVTPLLEESSREAEADPESYRQQEQRHPLRCFGNCSKSEDPHDDEGAPKRKSAEDPHRAPSLSRRHRRDDYEHRNRNRPEDEHGVQGAHRERLPYRRPLILVDTRERPLVFSDAVDVQRAKLAAGDYTLAGCSDPIVFELRVSATSCSAARSNASDSGSAPSAQRLRARCDRGRGFRVGRARQGLPGLDEPAEHHRYL